MRAYDNGGWSVFFLWDGIWEPNALNDGFSVLQVVQIGVQQYLPKKDFPFIVQINMSFFFLSFLLLHYMYHIYFLPKMSMTAGNFPQTIPKKNLKDSFLCFITWFACLLYIFYSWCASLLSLISFLYVLFCYTFLCFLIVTELCAVKIKIGGYCYCLHRHYRLSYYFCWFFL